MKEYERNEHFWVSCFSLFILGMQRLSPAPQVTNFLFSNKNMPQVFIPYITDGYITEIILSTNMIEFN